MSEELMMDLADGGSPERLLSVIFRHHPEWGPPIPLETLAHKVGIVEFKDLELDGFEGALMTNAEKSEGVILVKENTSLPRWRFTAAHELGHFLIPSHKGNRQCTKDDLRESRRDTEYRRQEAEANRFAAGLLMPKQLFSRHMGRMGKADVSHIMALARAFKVSMEAAANRYIELTDDTCAVVFSKDGVIRYIQPAKDFPRLGVWKGHNLPALCKTVVSPPSSLHIPGSWEEQDGSIWLETVWGKRPPSVIEQSMRQQNGFQVTLLFIEAAQEDDEPEGEALEESWSVRFRRR